MRRGGPGVQPSKTLMGRFPSRGTLDLVAYRNHAVVPRPDKQRIDLDYVVVCVLNGQLVEHIN